MENIEETWYSKIGEDKIKELVGYFYGEVRENKVLAPMYPEDLAGAEERLFLFLVQYLGGPNFYSQKRGHPRLKMRHMVFPVNEESIQEWLRLMFQAIEKTELDAEANSFLIDYFTKTAAFLKNR